MPRKPRVAPVVCRHFTWRLFCRDGVYYADGRGGKYELGKHSLGTRDHEKALANLRILDARKARELGIAQEELAPQSGTTSIADGWRHFLDHCSRSPVMGGVSAGTLKRYTAIRDHHLAFCRRHGIEYWHEFNMAALEKYAKGRNAAYRTLYCELTTLKSVNHWLIGRKYLPADCKLEYKLTKPQGTDTYCYSANEVATMVKCCLAKPALVWLAHVIITLAHAGMRISELAGLRWSDVDLKAKTIRVADERASHRKQQIGTARTTKGRRSRTIPIHPRLYKLLLTMDQSAGGPVFRAQHGGPLRPNNVLHTFIKRVIKPLKKQFPTPEGEIGFEHGRLHSFRHFFCSQAFLGGASEGEIKEWLGHADSKMVEHYRHLRNEDAQRKMDQIEFFNDENDGDESSTEVA